MNSMQKSMLQWNEMYPYSAAHVVQISGTLDTTRLQACIDATLATRGMTCLRLDHDHFTFQYESGNASCQFRTIAGDEGPQ